jgi:hypothetical protein
MRARSVRADSAEKTVRDPPPPTPLGITHALCRFSSASRPSNHPLPDRQPPSRHHAISRLGLWCWTASDLASLEYHSPLSEVGNSASRQAEDRQGWSAKAGLGAPQAPRERKKYVQKQELRHGTPNGAAVKNPTKIIEFTCLSQPLRLFREAAHGLPVSQPRPNRRWLGHPSVASASSANARAIPRGIARLFLVLRRLTNRLCEKAARSYIRWLRGVLPI